MAHAQQDLTPVKAVTPGRCFSRSASAHHVFHIPATRLTSGAAEALATLLPMLGCGEEAAALAFEGLAEAHRQDPQAHAALRAIASEELVHDGLLHALAGILPAPVGGAETMLAMRRFHIQLGRGDAVDHLARIAALDSAVCTLLARLTRKGTPIAADPASRAVLKRIQADEASHVRVSRRLAMVRRDRALNDIALPAREALGKLLARAGDQLEALAFDPRWLATLIAPIPPGLFKR